MSSSSVIKFRGINRNRAHLDHDNKQQDNKTNEDNKKLLVQG